MCESKRKPVYARNKRIRHFMPPVMVDYIAANFGNGEPSFGSKPSIASGK